MVWDESRDLEPSLTDLGENSSGEAGFESVWFDDAHRRVVERGDGGRGREGTCRASAAAFLTTVGQRKEET